MYKGIVDSGPISTEPLTVLVGKNESGKTSILEALHKLNPATPKPYQIEQEWPRGRRRERKKDHVVCSAVFQLSADEITHLKTLTDQNADLESVGVTRTYEGHLEVIFPEAIFPDKLHPNAVDGLCDSLPAIPDGLGATFCEIASRCRDEVHRLAHDGRLSEIEKIRAQQGSQLQAAFTQPPNAQEPQYHGQYVAKLQELVQKISTIPSIRRQAHEYLVGQMPKFIYMADYRTFKGKALLDQVKQRRDAKQLTPDDETFLMILALSGLDLDDLVAKGGKADRDQRQYDLDDGGKTLTRVFSNRLKQREYTVEFRADGQEFYTMVTDANDAALIKLEERSKGFQWYFSFDLLFMHESDGTFKDRVLLLDEPGLHLHPGAQRDLLGRLDEYAKGNTLIYSTHLPFMLDLRHPERIRVISETENGSVVSSDLTQTQPEEKLTLQAALGISGSQSYLLARRNVVVEGADDFMILTELSNLFVRSAQDGLADDVHVTAAGGASEAAYIATFMIGQKLDVVVLLDSDPAGDQARDKLVKSWLTRYKGKETQVLSLGAVVGKSGCEFSLEDLFPDDFYLGRVKTLYKKELGAASVNEIELVGTGQICKRVERALAEHAIKFNKGSVAKRIRADLTRMKSVDELPKETKDYAAKLLAALRQALPD
jgi:predicted ATPase/5S rRNA maturation endonuclease (ribonuclease M5)